VVSSGRKRGGFIGWRRSWIELKNNPLFYKYHGMSGFQFSFVAIHRDHRMGLERRVFQNLSMGVERHRFGLK
jgi:hypothetical protein